MRGRADVHGGSWKCLEVVKEASDNDSVLFQRFQDRFENAKLNPFLFVFQLLLVLDVHED